MVFNDIATKQGLIQYCETKVFSNYGDITGNANRLYDFTARLNRAYDKVATLIMQADGRWQWDDTNYTDLPRGRRNLVSGQQDYTLDVEHLLIAKVIVYDQSGTKRVIYPIDISDQGARPYLTDTTTTGGSPTSYDKMGTSILLYPFPNYNYTNGLEVYYQRKPSYFTYEDTTKSAGIPAIFHPLLAMEACLDYAIDKQKNLKNDLAFQVKAMEEDLLAWYAKRARDEQKFISPVNYSSR